MMRLSIYQRLLKNIFYGVTMKYRYSRTSSTSENHKNEQIFYPESNFVNLATQKHSIEKHDFVNIFSSFDFNSCTHLESSIMSCNFSQYNCMLNCQHLRKRKKIMYTQLQNIYGSNISTTANITTRHKCNHLPMIHA